MSKTAKAILIDEDNKDRLTVWYNDDICEGLIRQSVGYYLVCEFGEMDYMLLSKPTLDAIYTTTGKQLENGYFEVDKK